MLKKTFLTLSILILGLFALAQNTNAKGLKTFIKEPYKLSGIKKQSGLKATNFNIEGNHIKNEVIIKFRSDIGVSSSIAKSAITSLAGAQTKRTDKLAQFTVVKLPKGKTVDEAIKYYENLPEVEYAESNYIVRSSWTPNDVFFSFQWHFSKINMTTAWDYDTTPPLHGGDPSIIVAVVDTGVAYENYDVYSQAPDLASTTFVQGWDYINNDSHPNDDNGHGTHVAGTIAQSTDNSIGVAGMAFHSKIMPIKVLNSAGSGSIDTIVSGIAYAQNNGAKVINMSLGTTAYSQLLEETINSASNAGIVLVAATGNGGADGIGDPELDYPGRFSAVIGVGATRFNNARSPYSNYGLNIALVAPGGDTSVDQNSDGYADGVLQNTFSEFGGTITNYGSFAYAFSQGTSMATPHIAGAVALLLANGVPASAVKGILTSSTTDLGIPGTDSEYGAGILNMSAAFAYPMISSVSPSSGSNDSATNITITGANFAFGSVTGVIDSTSLTNVSYVNATTITATVPSHLGAGSYTISITTDGKTTSLPNAFTVTDPAPSAPSGFSAAPGDERITLGWTKPTNWDFAGIKIMRKTSGYPANQNDGKLVYQGTGKTKIDKNLKNGKKYYYSAFAYDSGGNYSTAAQANTAPNQTFLITGPDRGKSNSAASYDDTGTRQSKTFNPFGGGYRGGVNVTTGDLDGNGTQEIIFGTQEGQVPRIRIFDRKGNEKFKDGGFYPFGMSYKCGVNVASADVNNDGKDETIAGLGYGCASQVKIFNKRGKLISKKASFKPYGGKTGVKVAAGDVNGDGTKEVITAPGKGMAAKIYIYNQNGKKVLKKKGFTAFSSKSGVELFAGDVNFNGMAEIIVVPQKGESAYVKVFKYTGKKVYKNLGFYPFGSYKDGVNMTVGDLNSDGYTEILAVKKSGNEVSVYSYKKQKKSPKKIDTILVDSGSLMAAGKMR